jgi:hypothetical protein
MVILYIMPQNPVLNNLYFYVAQNNMQNTSWKIKQLQSSYLQFYWNINKHMIYLISQISCLTYYCIYLIT